MPDQGLHARHNEARIHGRTHWRARKAYYPEPTLFPQISLSGNVLMTVWLHPEGGFVPATKCVTVRIREAGIATIEQ
jgi:hypothetical protein